MYVHNFLRHRASLDGILGTILNAEGDVKTISGQFKRQDLCAEHKLNVSIRAFE